MTQLTHPAQTLLEHLDGFSVQIDAARAPLLARRWQNEFGAKPAERGIGEMKFAAIKLRDLGHDGKAEADAAARASAATDPAAAGPTTPSEPIASGSERQEYDAAMAKFRDGDFKAAQSGFAGFIKRYPRSGLAPSALFWLGNAQYATRDYKEAITNFRSLLTASPSHQRAPEAMLSIANCQIELKDTKAARETLDSLIKTYPQSEAAAAGRERLARLK